MGTQGATGSRPSAPDLRGADRDGVRARRAIPALLGYNFIGARIRELSGEADAFLADFLALIERDYVREDRP